MKLDIDLPWGGKLHIEKPAMSKDAAYTLSLAIGFLGAAGFVLALIWILR